MSQEITEVRLNMGLVAIIDSRDVELVSRYNWNACQGRNTFYAQATTEIGRILMMHRFIINPGRGLMVDHINGNGLDNRRLNLRIATHSQNAANKRKPRTAGATSVHKGVYFDQWGSRWRAQIRINGRKIHLGNFPTESQAASAYDTAAREHFGEFARLNF